MTPMSLIVGEIFILLNAALALRQMQLDPCHPKRLSLTQCNKYYRKNLWGHQMEPLHDLFPATHQWRLSFFSNVESQTQTLFGQLAAHL